MPREFLDLVNGFLDGGLSTEEQAHLDVLLEGSPNRVAAFRRTLALHGQLLGHYYDAQDTTGIFDKIQEAQPNQAASSVLQAIQIEKRKRTSMEGAVVARRGVGRAGWLGVVAASLLVVAGVFFLLFRSSGSDRLPVVGVLGSEINHAGKVEKSAFEVKKKMPTIVRGSAYLEGSPGAKILKGDLVRTATDVKAMVHLNSMNHLVPGKTLVHLEPNTELSFGLSKQGGHRLRLDGGKVKLAVSRQPKGKPLAVVTPDATATVVGTQFQIAVHEGQTRLEVKEGIVQFGQGGPGLHKEKTVMVKGGHYAVARKNQPLHPPKILARAIPKRKPVILSGYLSRETLVGRGKYPGQSRYFLTDRFNNKYSIGQNREGKAEDLLEHYVDKLVWIKGRGVLRGSPGKKKFAMRLEYFQLEQIMEMANASSESFESELGEDAKKREHQQRKEQHSK